MFTDTGSVLEMGKTQIHNKIAEEKACPCVSVCTEEMAHISNAVVWATESEEKAYQRKRRSKRRRRNPARLRVRAEDSWHSVGASSQGSSMTGTVQPTHSTLTVAA